MRRTRFIFGAMVIFIGSTTMSEAHLPPSTGRVYRGVIKEAKIGEAKATLTVQLDPNSLPGFEKCVFNFGKDTPVVFSNEKSAKWTYLAVGKRVSVYILKPHDASDPPQFAAERVVISLGEKPK